MSIEVVYKSFRGTCSEDLESYRALKTTIFREELGWLSLDVDADKMVLLDYYDHTGHFISAKTEEITIGVVRGVSLRDGFPHKSYFKKDIDTEEIECITEVGFSINSLAVMKAFRKQHIGTALLHKIQECFVEDGKSVCLLTAIRNQSELFFEKQGYKTIGKEFEINNPKVALCNMIRRF